MESNANGQTHDPDSTMWNRGSVWFDDGNIVLRTGNQEFRVHRSLLTRCSSVFKDMFLLPRPSTDTAIDSTIDGIPVVQLQDSAEDLTCLLSAIYDHPNSGTTPTADIVPLPLSVVSALLRLGHKYDISHLRDNSLYRLRKEYAPSSFDSISLGDFIYLVDHKGIQFDVVKFFNDEGIFSALPLALYEVITHDTLEAAFDGIDRDDNTRATLPPTLVRSCILGKDKLIGMLSEVVFKWLLCDNPRDKDCSKNYCTKTFQSLIKRIWIPRPDITFALASNWDQITAFLEKDGHLICLKCAKEGRQLTEAGQRAVWEALPSVFGFGSWDDVKRMERQW